MSNNLNSYFAKDIDKIKIDPVEIGLNQPVITSSEAKNLRNIKINANNMTSIDYQFDNKAHVNDISHYLNDKSRINFFKNSILYNKHLFKGRTVLEISTHIGILSLFAAKAGAAKVYTVDCSNVLDYTRKLIKNNGYENVIEIIKNYIESIELPVDKVDIIISDCLGFCLLYHSTIDVVIYARDKWLKPNGIIIPDKADLYVAGFENNEFKNRRLEWWINVYGFDMSIFKKWAMSEPFLQNIKRDMVKTENVLVKTINFYTVKCEELQVNKIFVLQTPQMGGIDGIVSYFDMSFSKSHIPFNFSTSPNAPRTNFLQMLFYFDQSIKSRSTKELICELQIKSIEENFNKLIVNFSMKLNDENFEKIWLMKCNSTIVHNIPKLAFTELYNSKKVDTKEELEMKQKENKKKNKQRLLKL